MDHSKPSTLSERWLRFPFHFDAPNKQKSATTKYSTSTNSHDNHNMEPNNGHFYANTPQNKNTKPITNDGHLYGNSPPPKNTLPTEQKSTTPPSSLKERTYSVSTTAETEVDVEEKRAEYNDVLERIQNMAIGSSMTSSLDLPESDQDAFTLKTKSHSDGHLQIPKKKEKKKSIFTFTKKKGAKEHELQNQLDKVNEEISFDPDNLHLYLKRAKIYGIMGNKEEAKRDYDIIQNPSPSMVNRTNRIAFQSSDNIQLPDSILKKEEEECKEDSRIDVIPGARLQGSKSLPAEAFRLRKYE